MKLLKVALSMLSLTGIASCGSLKPCPITTGTTKIVYSEFENSGIAISTKYEITQDSLVWDYTELRYNRHLKDAVTYNRQDFEALVTELSAIRFSAKDTHDASAGGGGWGCSFYNDKECYFHYNDAFILSGAYEAVTDAILQFVASHKPEGLRLFDQLKAEPHESAMFGEFEQLPEPLEPYLIKKQ